MNILSRHIHLLFTHLLIYLLRPGVGDLICSYNGVRKMECTFKQEFTKETKQALSQQIQLCVCIFKASVLK